jgi:hypothetical protein
MHHNFTDVFVGITFWLCHLTQTGRRQLACGPEGSGL